MLLEDLSGAKIGRQIRIGAVVAPRVADLNACRFSRIGSGAALLDLAPSTLVLLNGYGLGLRRGEVVRRHLDEFGNLLNACPYYRLELGRDHDDNRKGGARHHRGCPMRVPLDEKRALPESRVTCVIPAWNAAETIERTVESALRQTAPPIEILVVDDGSTDRTAEIAGSIGATVRLIRQANAGAEAARNRGISEAFGEFIALLDADDVWQPEKLERQLAAVRERPEVGIVGCLVMNVGDPEDAGVQAQLRRYGGKPVLGWKESDVFARQSAFEAADCSTVRSGIPG